MLLPGIEWHKSQTMKRLRLIGMALFAFMLCVSITSCEKEDEFVKLGQLQYNSEMKLEAKWVAPFSVGLDIASSYCTDYAISTDRAFLEQSQFGDGNWDVIRWYDRESENNTYMGVACKLCNRDIIIDELTPNTTYYIMPCYTPDNQGKPTAQWQKGEIIEITTPNKEEWTEEIVDLGLDVKWRGWNLDANDPFSTGSFYIWGNTKPTTYNHSNLTYYPEPPTINIESICGTKYDAATVNLGENWRLPTYEDVHDELLNKTTCTIIYTKNTILYDFKSKINDKHLYIPASAYIPYMVKDYGSGRLTIYGEEQIENESEYDIPYFWIGDFGDTGNNRHCLKGNKVSLVKKYWGLPIRPVYEDKK